MARVWSTVKKRLFPAMMAAIACTLLGFATVPPTLALGHSSSQATDGTEQMNNLQEASRRALGTEPRSGESVRQKAQKGPNAVQGEADVRGMNAPPNSPETTTVRKQVERALEQITPGD